MILGFDFYGTQSNIAFATSCALSSFNRLDLSNSVVDEIYIDSDITKIFNSSKDEWGYTTVMDAKFQDNLSGGNVDNKGIPIEQIKFRKRKTDTLEWTDVAIFNYDTMVKIYTFIDNIIASNTDYEYCIVPITQGVVGNSLLGTITTSFDGTWISDNNNSYKLLYDLSYGDIENVLPTTVIETFSQFPTILNSPVDYKKSTIKCKVLTDTTVDTCAIDVKGEKQLRDNMLKFFKNRSPKILKDSNGRFYLVALMNFKETPNNDLKQKVSDISFDWVEIGDSENPDDLRNAGLLI